MKSYEFINLLGYKIYRKSMKECLDYIEKRNKVHIVSGNPEVLYTGLYNDTLYKNFTSDESIIIPDGVGTKISARIVNSNVEEKIAGIDLMKNLIKECEMNNRGIYLLGASDDSLKGCIGNLLVEYPNIKILGYRNGFFDMNNANEIIEDIRSKSPYALFVAMGCPRQETFIVKYMDELPCKIFMGVGGSFDVIAERVNRAPKWMINIGLEWFYRVAREPWRIKRLGSIPKFLWLVIKNKRIKNEGK